MYGKKAIAREVGKLCVETFPRLYCPRELDIVSHIFSHEDFDMEASLVAVELEKTKEIVYGKCKTLKASDLEKNRLVGFIGVKIYLETAYISLFAVLPSYQRKGIGTKLYKESVEELYKKNVKKLVLGEDFEYCFPGLPIVNNSALEFFRKNNFNISEDKIYDLYTIIDENQWLNEYEPTDEIKDGYELTKAFEEAEVISFLKNHERNRIIEYIIRFGYTQYINIIKIKDEIEGLFLSIPNNEKKSGNLRFGAIESVANKFNKDINEYLVYKALLHQKKKGVISVVINGTKNNNMYENFGFKKLRTYRYGAKDLN